MTSHKKQTDYEQAEEGECESVRNFAAGEVVKRSWSRAFFHVRLVQLHWCFTILIPTGV